MTTSGSVANSKYARVTDHESASIQQMGTEDPTKEKSDNFHLDIGSSPPISDQASSLPAPANPRPKAQVVDLGVSSSQSRHSYVDNSQHRGSSVNMRPKENDNNKENENGEERNNNNEDQNDQQNSSTGTASEGSEQVNLENASAAKNVESAGTAKKKLGLDSLDMDDKEKRPKSKEVRQVREMPPKTTTANNYPSQNKSKANETCCSSGCVIL